MFQELSAEAHLLLLKLFLKEDISKTPQRYFEELDEATLIHRISLRNGDKHIGFKYEINKRGIAFVHQQRNPADLQKLEKAPIGFLNKLHKIVCLGRESDFLTENLMSGRESKKQALQSLDRGLKQFKTHLNNPQKNIARPLEELVSEELETTLVK